MHSRNAILVAAIATAALSTMASAATTATATATLNIRSGPGPQYGVIGVINDNGQAVVTGCIQGSLWCQVSYNGEQGWAYSKYLTMARDGQTVVLSEQPASVPMITYQAPTVETVGAAPPPVSGTLVTTTPGAPITIAPPPPTVQTYVVEHPVNPVTLNGEVVVGAGLPSDVALAPVPDYDYDYAYVNQMPVLVEPSTRRIVYIYR
jgi:uncharacterized protein YraI